MSGGDLFARLVRLLGIVRYQANISKALNGAMFHKVKVSSLKLSGQIRVYACRSQTGHFKALVKTPAFPTGSCYKENGFSLDLMQIRVIAKGKLAAGL